MPTGQQRNGKLLGLHKVQRTNEIALQIAAMDDGIEEALF
jgi:hypothetical protein